MGPTRLVLEVDRVADPVRGCLWTAEHEAPMAFVGWLGLFSALDAVLHGQPPPASRSNGVIDVNANEETQR